MASIFDAGDFTDSLFFPRRDATPPGGATDHAVDVGGATVHLRVHPAPGARCTLLLFHGNGEVVADYDDAAALFADAGAGLAVADYRGYGQSTGTPTLRALIADAHPIARMVSGPMIVMGRSLGAAAAHELYARPPANLLGVVLESAFSDLRGLIRRRGLRPPTTFTPEELATFDPATKLAAGTLPALVLHGARDTLIEPREAEVTLAALGGSEKTLVWIEGRGHNDVSMGDGYWSALATFIERLVVRRDPRRAS